MTIVSGIQPSGKLHVGNYLGAVKNWLEMQKDASNRCFFFIADWHSLTETYDPKEKAAQVRELVAELLALGIDPERVTLFRQSDIPEHLELAWYFACVTPVNEMERMTQYKDKTARGHSPNTALFTYPILMAADILAYSGDEQASVHVPVGHDQLQHLELTNEIARWFNNRYGATFASAKPILTPQARIMSLKDPAHKMSKSLGGDHCLFLDDTPEEIERKVKAAVTDTRATESAISNLKSEISSMTPGVATLFSILEAFGTSEEVVRFQNLHNAGAIKYSEVKPAVSAAVASFFTDFRTKKAQLLADPTAIDAVLAHGAETARTVAGTTLDRIRTVVGIR